MKVERINMQYLLLLSVITVNTLLIIYWLHITLSDNHAHLASLTTETSSIAINSEYCECGISHSRKIASDIKFESTTCGRTAFERGPHQKVIAFTYYKLNKTNPSVKERLYFKGINHNLQNITKLYPGWIMRLYFHIEKDDLKTKETLCELLRKHSNLDLCKVDALPGRLGLNTSVHPGNWRFFPTLDPQVY